jgi:hypothetical protein
MAAPAAYARRSLVGDAAATNIPLGLTSGAGSCSIGVATNWPTGSVGPFLVVIDRGVTGLEEKSWCSALSGTTLTFSLRGAEGTTAQTHGLNCTIALCIGSTDADEANQLVSGTLGQSGLAVGDLFVVSSVSGPNTLARLANGVEAKQFLRAGTSTPAYTDLFNDTAQTSLYTSKAYDMVRCTTGTFTVNTPTAKQVGSLVGIVNYGTGVVTVTASSGVIYGVGLTSSGAASLKLGTPGAFVILYDDGTNYEVVAGEQDTGWTTVSVFTNSWAVYTSLTIAYRLTGNILRLRGAAAGGANGTAAFTLPAGFRPQTALNIPTAVASSAYGTSSAAIATSGVVTLTFGGTLTYMGLDGLSFTVD